MKLYICGPMTDLPEFNFPAFNKTATTLVAAGFEVSNPADNGAAEPGLSWADYMRRDIPDLLGCDGVAVLSNWWKSRGASLEVHIATALGMPVETVMGWLERRTAA